MTAHEFTGWRCCVAHYDANGSPLPACHKCVYCGWIADNDADGECPRLGDPTTARAEAAQIRDMLTRRKALAPEESPA